MNILRGLLGAVAVVLASTGLAQTRLEAFAEPKLMPPQAGSDECDIGPHLPGVQCFAEARKRQDARLHAAYRRALAALTGNDAADHRRNRAQLVKAQTAWLTYRQAHCAVVGSQEGGSNMSVTYNAQRCESNLTDERINFITSIAGNEK